MLRELVPSECTPIPWGYTHTCLKLWKSAKSLSLPRTKCQVSVTGPLVLSGFSLGFEAYFSNEYDVQCPVILLKYLEHWKSCMREKNGGFRWGPLPYQVLLNIEVVSSDLFPVSLWLGHEKNSTAILPLLLIQEEQLSVIGERMCTEYWYLPRRLAQEQCG